MAEYNDCHERAQRLAVAREMYLEGKLANSVLHIKQEDLLIYLRWLVCHLRSLKKFNQYMRVRLFVALVLLSNASLHHSIFLGFEVDSYHLQTRHFSERS